MVNSFAAQDAFLITKDADTFFDAVRADSAGTVVIVTRGGDSVTFTCVAGEIIPLCGTKVTAASTAATVHGFLKDPR